MNDSKYGRLYPERAVAPLRMLAQDFVMGERVLVEDFQRALEDLDRLGFPPEEPLFLLRGQDILAPHTVRYWANYLINEQESQGLQRDIAAHKQLYEFANRMEAWEPRKMPD